MAEAAVGGVLTGVCNFGIPAFMLGFGAAALTYKPLIKIIKGLMKDAGFLSAIGASLAAFGNYIIGSSLANKEMNWRAFTNLADVIFSPAATAVLEWVLEDVAVTTAAEQIPFAGWLVFAINFTAGIGQMVQTIVAIATSDWNIEHKIALTITTKVTVNPDPRNKAFPTAGKGAQRSLIVKMIYKDEKRPTVTQTIAVPEGSKDPSFTASFPNNTLGGEVKFEADFYVNSWLAGKATTGLRKNDAYDAAEVTMALVELPPPLTEKSIYKHQRILTYDNNAYGWTDTTKAPDATIRSNGPAGNEIASWTGLALSQRTGLLGASWQADGMGIADCVNQGTGQLYAFMNFNIPGTAMTAVKFPGCGFTGQSRLIYDPYPPKFLMDGDGQWVLDEGFPVPDPKDVSVGNYYIDPRSAPPDMNAPHPFDQGQGFHLRRVTLDDNTPFDMSSSQKSFGRFAYFPDSVCLHPSGLVISVNTIYQKLQIVTMNKEGLADKDTPLGAIGAGPALDQTRPGLMFFPVAVTCAYDGRSSCWKTPNHQPATRLHSSRVFPPTICK